MDDVSDIENEQRERGRLRTTGPADRQRGAVHAAADPREHRLLGAPGVRLPQADMVALCEAILERAR
jgi:hypothetical protein